MQELANLALDSCGYVKRLAWKERTTQGLSTEVSWGDDLDMVHIHEKMIRRRFKTF
jgi:hypothetical protein